jgi:hypothetical protein
MRRRLAQAAPAFLTILLAFFDQGCTVQARKELLDEVKLYAGDQLKEFAANELPKLKDQAGALVQAKLDAAEKAQLAVLDQQLLKVAEKDSTGTLSPKTWKDFAADKGISGRLAPNELAAAMTYITSQVAKGHGDRGALTGGGGAVGLLLVYQLLRAGKNKFLPGPAAAAPPQPGNGPPGGAAPPAVPPAAGAPGS